MAEPTSREELKQRIRRELGEPVIEVNVADEQIEDQIDTALRYFWDYHFSGSDKVYYPHAATQTDIDNRYLTLPENIISVTRIFPIGEALSSNNIFSIRYQIALNDLYTLTSSSMVPYFSAFQHIRLIEEILIGQKPIRFNRHRNRLYIDMNWAVVNPGDYLIAESYEAIDPDVYTDVWRDRFLIKYTTALVKKQWGNNLKKFSGMQLPGGIQMNGQKIYDEAVEEISSLETEMIQTYSIPNSLFIG